MKTILIVDDQQEIITLLLSILRAYIEEAKIFTAYNGEEAIAVLSREHIDLVITDLIMPVISGLELLGCLLNNYPSTSIIVMTGAGSVEIEEHVYACGSFGYIEKPIKIDLLIELIESALFPTATGHIKGINLPSFLQLLNLERKTCVVKVSFNSRNGYLYFTQGEMIDAQFEMRRGEGAVYEILKWPNPEIEIQNVSVRVTKTINMPLEHILMESAKKQDEYRRDSGSFQRITLGNLILDSDLIVNPLDSASSTINAPVKNTQIGLTVPVLSLNSTNNIQVPQNGFNPRNSLEQKIIRKWKFVESAFSDQTACVFATYIGQEETTLLQGTDNIETLSEEVASILNIIFFFSNDSIQGTFEYINNLFGLIIIWDRLENYSIVVADGFADTKAITFFSRKRLILEKTFLSH